ncbi:MAG: hypothetical protein HZA50_00285 [Planctomycetes bacterium]|nr:hypothetical protein [Planctomycetota bacterium]
MSDVEKNNPQRPDDNLLKDLLSMGGRIRRQRYPGNAWQDARARQSSPASAGRGRFLRLILPALTAAAALIFIAIGVSHILNPTARPTGIKITRTDQPDQADETFFALPIPSGPQMMGGTALEMASSSDLPMPDASRLPGNFTMSFQLPEISMPTAASAGIEWKTPSLTMTSFERS